jgi:iron complex transport system substrate-binding protein
VAELDAALADVAASVAGAPRPVSPPIGRRPQTSPTIGLIEWLDPPMIAGGWMVELAHIAGAEPVIVTDPRRFETTDWETIARADPEVVLITPCGFSVERTLTELAAPSIGDPIRGLRATREGRTYVADGNAYFNRPGPRIAESARIIAAVCHPERLRLPAGVVRWP